METPCYIGIDLGGTRIKIGLVSEGKLMGKVVVPAQSANGLAASLPLIEAHVYELLKKFDLEASNLGGVGFGFPGLVDPFQKKILSTNAKYDDACSVDLEACVAQQWQVPFFIDNDARMATVGEWKFGVGQDTDNLVVMTIGTGIGTSAVIEGKLLRGRHFQAGCLGGHFSVQYGGRQCTCGNVGCMEAYAATWSLKERIAADPAFANSSLNTAPVLDFEVLFAAAKSGDALAQRMEQDCLAVWATGIINLIHAYDPEVVVLGGGVMHDADRILPYITEQVHRHAWCPWGKVQLRPSTLLSDAGIFGAVYCIQHAV